MKNKKIEINDNSSSLILGSSASLTNTKELFFNSGGTGDINSSSVDIDHLKVDDNSSLDLNGRCVTINNKLENLSSAEIIGSGCITYKGSNGDFVNSDVLFELNAFPNPAKTHVTIEGYSTEIIKVFSSQGVQLDEINIANSNVIEISTYPSGILLFQSGSTVVRVVKN